MTSFDYNDFVAIEQISGIRKELETNNEISAVSDHDFWNFVNVNWQNWRKFDSANCADNKSWDYFVSINDYWTESIVNEFGIKSKHKDYDYDVVQLCQIAYITADLVANGKIDIKLDTIDVMFYGVYKPILEEWTNGIGSKIFKNNDEEGYVGAFATRRLLEQYGVNWRERA